MVNSSIKNVRVNRCMTLLKMHDFVKRYVFLPYSYNETKPHIFNGWFAVLETLDSLID